MVGEVFGLQGREHPDHDEVVVRAGGAFLRTVERRPQRLLQRDRVIDGERSGRDVDLDVELSEFGLIVGGVGDRLEDGGVGHGRTHLLVDEIEFDLHTEQRLRWAPWSVNNPSASIRAIASVPPRLT